MWGDYIYIYLPDMIWLGCVSGGFSQLDCIAAALLFFSCLYSQSVSSALHTESNGIILGIKRPNASQPDKPKRPPSQHPIENGQAPPSTQPWPEPEPRAGSTMAV